MRFRDWLQKEFALTDFQRVGPGWETGKLHGYDQASAKLLSDPKAVESLHKRFQSTKHDFDLYFARGPKANKAEFREKGVVDPQWAAENIDPSIKANPNAITVVFVGNVGAEKIPMTPWIIAHRIAHAVSSARGGGGGEHRKFIDQIEREFFELLKTNYNFEKKSTYGMDVPSRYTVGNDEALRMLFNAIGTMRSARKGLVSRPNEFHHEVFAQYLLGKKVQDDEYDDPSSVNFNSLPKSLGKSRGKQLHHQYHDDEHMTYDNDSRLKHIAHWYESSFDKMLDGLKGKVLVM